MFVHQLLSHLRDEDGSWDIDSLALLTYPEPRLSALPGPESGIYGNSLQMTSEAG